MVGYRKLHPYIAEAYVAVHEWLAASCPDAKGYKKINSYRDCNDNNPLQSAAAQFHIYFPAHYFKVIHTFDSIITPETLLRWFEYTPQISVVDIGCGAGAGATALLEAILTLRHKNQITSKLDIWYLGIDANPGAVILYQKMLDYLQDKLSSENINLECDIVPKRIQESIPTAIRLLNEQRIKWNIPCLTNVILLQSNVIDILDRENEKNQKSYKLLNQYLQKDVAFNKENYIKYSKEYALEYKQLFEEVPIDYLHIVTIGTTNEKNKEYDDLQRVTEMSDALNQVFSEGNHKIDSLITETQKVDYENPEGSFWKDERNVIKYNSSFHVDFTQITNSKLTEDKHWTEVTSLENLESAWVKARNHLAKESFFDEVEIRLFEKSLEQNLVRLQKQLIFYVKEITQKDDYVNYQFVKNSLQTRPRSLPRLEEEILSVAIIQKLGKEASILQGISYAYRFKPENQSSESLYEHWFPSYRRFLDKVRTCVNNHDKCVILRIDIESFYTRIIQDHLIELTSNKITTSERIRWLIRLLITKNINNNELGHGITQGSIGSGFYANLYLKSIDSRFGDHSTDNDWNVTFRRYLDDMILIVPDPQDVNEVLNVIDQELKKLGLKLNSNKTERYYDKSKFLKTIQENPELDKLKDKFDDLVNILWIGSTEYREQLASAHQQNNNVLWWSLIENYQNLLKSVSIYIQPSELSRNIYRYLFNRREINKDLKGQKEININTILTAPSNRHFLKSSGLLENGWALKRIKLKKELNTLLKNNWLELKDLKNNDPDYQFKSRQFMTYIRFTIKKLFYIGFNNFTKKYVVDILCEFPWIFREPLKVLEALAIQGGVTELMEVMGYYQDNYNQGGEYLKAITLRAIRFLPIDQNKRNFRNSFNESVWELMVKYAIGGSFVERLMATETWLSLGHIAHQYTQEIHITNVYQALNSEPKPQNRLKKNYILILGMYKKYDLIADDNKDNDDMLRQAYEATLEADESDLFDDYEPSIIRSKYYSSKKQSNQESELISPY